VHQLRPFDRDGRVLFGGTIIGGATELVVYLGKIKNRATDEYKKGESRGLRTCKIS